MKTMQQLKHFLTMAELTPEALTELLALAKDIKHQPSVYQNALSHKKWPYCLKRHPREHVYRLRWVSSNSVDIRSC